MECTRVQNLLPDYSVELLDTRTHRAIEEHLAGCGDCRAELRALDAAVAMVETYGVRQPPPGLFNAVRNRIESGELRRERAPWWAFLYSGPARGVALAAAMSAVIMGLLMPAPTSTNVGFGDGGTFVRPGTVARGEVAMSIRQHAISAAEGPLTDRAAWEAYAQIFAQDRDQDGDQDKDEAPGVQ